MTLLLYLVINAVCIHLLILLLELLRPSWVLAKNFRAVNLEEYWAYLLLIAFVYRLIKGTIKKMLGISND